MAVKKEVEKCSEGLVLVTNEITHELKKLLKELLSETNVASVSKPTPVQHHDSKPSAPLFEGDRLIRLKEVLEIIPVGKSTWWAGVKTGRYPSPVRHLGPRITAWSLSSILSLISLGEDNNHAI